MKNGEDASSPAGTSVDSEENVNKRVAESNVQDTLYEPAWQV